MDLADLAVLDAPDMAVPETRISEIRSLRTLVGATAVYDARVWVRD